MKNKNTLLKPLKIFLIPTLLLFLFSGCFSFQNIYETVNPFSSSKDKKVISVPENSPTWLKNTQIKDKISAIGATKNISKEESNFYFKKALIAAQRNLLKRVYSKTLFTYKNIDGENLNSKIFEKDIKDSAKQISLRSLKKAKIQNAWTSPEDEFFIQLSIDSKVIAQEIQYQSKILLKKDIVIENIMSLLNE